MRGELRLSLGDTMGERVSVPEQVRPLPAQFAARSLPKRELVIIAARQFGRRLRLVPWSALQKLAGTVALGGDAVEASKALYDHP